MKGFDGDEPNLALQMLVNQDMKRILEYGQRHPDDYAGRWFTLEDRAYGVGFTGSLQQHQAALSGLLNLPERLQIRSHQHSYRTLEKVCEQLSLEARQGEQADNSCPAIIGWGPDETHNAVRVRIHSSRPDVSGRLTAKYGSLIILEQGNSIAVAF